MQAEIDRRHHRLDKRRDDEIKITESDLIVIGMDRILPKRHRLDEATDFRLRMKFGCA
ncbi:hypothetical protein [Blastochloris sulfoviridis]|uniref:hypothetical protein n=1 Tax=Blastochloris sulfoviridis TaxID=50712 RepID=UPI001478E472|nr:hypothetical protein [Blastochloris sulfoviridis]